MSRKLPSGRKPLQTSEAIESPEWHKRILDERRRPVEDGTARFEDWEKAKTKIRESIALRKP
jgi:hypothetical protein